MTHAAWSPSGVNLAWTALLPGLPLLFAPLTLAAGPVISYSIAAVLMPALDGVGRLSAVPPPDATVSGRRSWAAIFSASRAMCSVTCCGHMHVDGRFRHPAGRTCRVAATWRMNSSAWALVVRLGPLLALEVLISTEVAFTLTVALACSLVVAFAVAPALRSRLVTSIVPLGGAYALAAVLTAPFDYYLLTGISGKAIQTAPLYNADLLNFVVPTRLTLRRSRLGRLGFASIHRERLGAGRLRRCSPALVIVALFAWRRRRTPGARFLVIL